MVKNHSSLSRCFALCGPEVCYALYDLRCCCSRLSARHFRLPAARSCVVVVAALTWLAAQLGEDHGAYSFRSWEASWTAKSPGRHTLEVRATDEKGNTQSDEPVWNAGGYLWNRIERQEIVVGSAS
jgi:hypothetical protein